MKVDEFKVRMDATISEFRQHWKEQQEKAATPSEWPEDLSYDDWMEHFLAWIDD